MEIDVGELAKSLQCSEHEAAIQYIKLLLVRQQQIGESFKVRCITAEHSAPCVEPNQETDPTGHAGIACSSRTDSSVLPRQSSDTVSQ